MNKNYTAATEGISTTRDVNATKTNDSCLNENECLTDLSARPSVRINALIDLFLVTEHEPNSNDELFVGLRGNVYRNRDCVRDSECFLQNAYQMDKSSGGPRTPNLHKETVFGAMPISHTRQLIKRSIRL